MYAETLKYVIKVGGTPVTPLCESANQAWSQASHLTEAQRSQAVLVAVTESGAQVLME